MNDDISMYLDKSDPSSYIESLVRCRALLSNSPTLLAKLDEVVSEELDLALMGAKKAKSEILKKSKDNILKPIK